MQDSFSLQTAVGLVVMGPMQIWTSTHENTMIARPESLSADALADFDRRNPGYIGKNNLDEKIVRESFAFDLFPIPPTDLREGYFGSEHLDYWLSGWVDIQKARQHCPELPASRKILDFGCSSGRTLRHLLTMCPEAEIWGADIKRASVEWLRTHFISDRARYFHASVNPYLPFESGSFDKIFAYSVFTHLHQDEEPWLLELKRLLAPGGTLFLTVMTDQIWNQIPNNFVLSSLYANSLDQKKYNFKNPMPSEREVWTFKTEIEIYHQVVFHSTQYLKKNWSPFFKSFQIIPQGHNFQDLLILRK